MIAEIRKYIEDQLKNCANDYRKIDRPFLEDADIPNFPYQYNIEFGDIAPEIGADAVGYVDNIPVTLSLYVAGNAREGMTSDIFDQGYEDALILKALILDNSRIESQDYIKGITTSSITPILVGDSQEVYKYSCTFTFKISYGIGE